MSDLNISEIIYFCRKHYCVCDKKCNKAWGINERPKESLSKDPDDYEFLSDTELGEAPEISTTTEGGENKPKQGEEIPNKWCVRQCERCEITEIPKTSTIGGRLINPMIELNMPCDFSKRVKNISEDKR